jgi:hypothetical protein
MINHYSMGRSCRPVQPAESGDKNMNELNRYEDEQVTNFLESLIECNQRENEQLWDMVRANNIEIGEMAEVINGL